MLNKPLVLELKHEAGQTKKMLERVPYDQFTWKPHDKSMPLGRLAVHIAELPGWITMILKTNELDLGKMNYKPTEVSNTAALLQLLDKNVDAAVEALEGASDEALMEGWTLRRDDKVFFTMPRASVIRSMSMNHIIHHRAQLSVFLRLLDVPVPGMYGPSADET
jgi:uncharacterized damage-inducible protein DinB